MGWPCGPSLAAGHDQGVIDPYEQTAVPHCLVAPLDT
jgi:hypothetical protein